MKFVKTLMSRLVIARSPQGDAAISRCNAGDCFAGARNDYHGVTRSFLTILLCLFLLASCGCSCGGGGGGGDDKEDKKVPDIPDPEITPPTDGDLEDYYINTFESNGINITVDPHFIEFGTTSEDVPLEGAMTITNGTDSDKTFTMSIISLHGTFRIIDETDTESAYLTGDVIGAGSSKEYTVKFLANRLGVSTGTIEITTTEVSGYIHFPLRGRVTGPANFKVIYSHYMCDNADAPFLDILDFFRVAHGQTESRSFKICNTGGVPLTVNDIIFRNNSSGARSGAFDYDPFEPFIWEVEEAFTIAFFDYYNPPEDEPYEEPEYITYTGTIPYPPSAFSVVEHSTGASPAGLEIEAGDYIRFDAEFSPTLNAEAPEGQLFEPIPYAADMLLSTSLGDVTIDVVGATGGKEPVLELTYTPEGADIPLPIDLSSLGAAIPFGTATVFEDWVTEKFNKVTLNIANVGSGSKNLKIWANSIDSGYFTFIIRDPEQTFPIRVEAGTEETIDMGYAPTPEDHEASFSYNLGQLILKHTAGNGPRNRITLIGEEEGKRAVQIQQGGANLKYTYCEDPACQSRTRNFCVFKIGEGTEITFTVVNNSTLAGNTLTTTFVVIGMGGEARASPRFGSVTTEPGETSAHPIRFTPAAGMVDEAEITGSLLIANSFALEDDYDETLPSYRIDFKATASESGECTGSDGMPLDGTVTMIIDRITMVLTSLFEPARNHPAFKFHLPLDLNVENNWARVHGLEYDVSPDVSPVDQIRSYAHQFTNVRNCMPLPTNPYHLEFEEGSWNGSAQCSYEGEGFNVTGKEVCMANNGAETNTAPWDPSKTYHVFYHEFIKFNPTSCAPELFGKISTFSRQLTPTEETMEEVLRRLNAMPDATESEFEAITRPYSFNSYIQFNVPYTCSDGNSYSPGDRIQNNPEAIKACWYSLYLQTSSIVMTRNEGDIEECSYFQFRIEEGCIPGEEGCDSDPDDPDTWKGYGEYEPYRDPITGEEDDTKWDITLRNVHIQSFVLVHGGQNHMFSHFGKLLFSDLYVTLTTKAVGLTPRTGTTSTNPDWQDLIATRTRDDFERIEDVTTTEGGVFIPPARARDWWTEEGVNAFFTTSDDDQEECTDPLTQCRGNFMITGDNRHIVHAGEPVDYNTDKSRLLMGGLASFHGRGNAAPGFASENLSTGKGPALYFTFHGCLSSDTDLTEDAGCYADYEDTEHLEEYRAHGLVGRDEVPVINYQIFTRDRDRLTDYYNSGSNFYDGRDFYPSGTCGFGM